MHSSIDEYMWLNRYLMNCVGLWPLGRNATTTTRLFAKIRIILSIFLTCTLIVSEIVTILINWGDLLILAGVGCIAVAVIQLLFKLVYTTIHQNRFSQLFEEAKDIWSITDDAVERENFEKVAKLAKQITITFYIVAVSNIVTFTTAANLIWIRNYIQANGSFYKRNLPLELWYGVDTQTTPNFEIIFCYQIVAMAHCSNAVVGFDTTMMTLILHTCGQFRLVGCRFRKIGETIRQNEKFSDTKSIETMIKSKTEIRKCLKHYQRVIRMAKEINDFVSPVIFFLLMTSGVEVCLCGYALTACSKGSEKSAIVKFMMYLITIFIQLFIWCWPGELLIQDSVAVGDAVYFKLPSYISNVPHLRDLGFVIFRTQTECQITALSFQVMSLRKLTEVFNSAASYFALLRNFGDTED